MDNPDFVFHRYFSGLSYAQREKYKGRLDLDKFEPAELAKALEGIRDHINNRFVSNASTIETPQGAPEIYLDYVESSAKNALAFKAGSLYCIGITEAMLQHFISTNSVLWRLNAIADLFEIDFENDARDFLFQTLLLLQAQFIADHELGHMFHGHCEENESGFFYEEFKDDESKEDDTSQLRDQAHEVEADGYAVEMMLNGLFKDRVGSFIVDRLKPQIDSREFLLLLYILAVGSLLYRLPATPFVSAQIRTSSHPRGIVRMNVIMRDIWRWCGENDATLLSFVGLRKFQWVMACIQTAADRPEQQEAWLAQGQFLRSDEGKKYLRDLYSAREKLRAEMASRRWNKSDVL